MISASTEDVGMFEEARVASDAQPLQNALHKTEPSRQTANTRLIKGILSSTLPVVHDGACRVLVAHEGHQTQAGDGREGCLQEATCAGLH